MRGMKGAFMHSINEYIFLTVIRRFVRKVLESLIIREKLHVCVCIQCLSPILNVLVTAMQPLLQWTVPAWPQECRVLTVQQMCTHTHVHFKFYFIISASVSHSCLASGMPYFDNAAGLTILHWLMPDALIIVLQCNCHVTSGLLFEFQHIMYMDTDGFFGSRM